MLDEQTLSSLGNWNADAPLLISCDSLPRLAERAVSWPSFGLLTLFLSDLCRITAWLSKGPEPQPLPISIDLALLPATVKRPK